MRRDQIFVLMLVVLLPLTGCFDGGGVGEAEGSQDSASDDGTSTSPPDGSSTIPATTQSRTWFSSGGITDYYWQDGQNIASGQQRCIDYGPTYDSSTGEYIGEDCRETGYPTEASDWNLTQCTDGGGTPIWDTRYSGESVYRYAPRCLNVFSTINTTAGEALLIYQASGVDLRTTCDGLSTPSEYYIWNTYSGSNDYAVSNEYNIVPGSALSCTHEIYRTEPYDSSGNNWQVMWSLVYAIQDTTVV